MRVARRVLVMKNGVQYFHVISRVVDRRLIFGDMEREVFRRIMRQMETFSGVVVMAYSLMGNHFHILLKIPVPPGALSDQEVWERMKHIYSEERMSEFEEVLEMARGEGHEDRVEEFFKRMRGRMYDLSSYVKGLKQRFSLWYNIENGRKGTLWEERFRSVLVEGAENALMRVATYIDLNAVRAGIVNDASEYRWSSFGEAMDGGNRARRGLIELASGRGALMDWRKAEEHYVWVLRNRMDRDQGQARRPRGDGAGGERMGPSPGVDRIRSYTEGLVIGSREFVEEFYWKRRKSLCWDRRRISHPVQENGSERLYAYRHVPTVM